MASGRDLFDDEHEAFRETVRRWLAREVVPHNQVWERAGIVPRSLFKSAGEHGLLGFNVPEEYGGQGIDDFRFNVVLQEEFQRAGVNAATLGIVLHNDTCLPYFLRFTNEEQKRRWLPGIVGGDLITAIAMTEPDAGSDLAGIQTSAVRRGDSFIVNGAKTFITNGINSDLVITAVRTDAASRHGGISLLVVESGTPGFERGRRLEKIGIHAQDTAELFYNDVNVPASNLLGGPGAGFRYLMQNLAKERMSIAATGMAAARQALVWTVEYARQRTVFGKSLGSFQNTRFVLAELATAIEVAQAFFDRCVKDLNRNELAPDRAAMAKYWCTELHQRVSDRCLQLFGGYGYMTEYPIARSFVDARVTTIYGGTSEVMKEIVARSLNL
jgi:alkylation response protein AidB-like acyl-CoA dehydrogenase